jgi:Domain of unknown function (DUF4129)
MLVLLAVAATATGRSGGASSAPPGAHAISTAGHHAALVVGIVLVPILAVVGFTLLMYAQIMKRRERDPEVLRRRREARRRLAVVIAFLAAIVIYRIRTHRNPLAFLHLRNPFSTLNGAHGGAPGLQHPHTSAGHITGTDWTLAALVWAALAAATVFAYLRIRARRRDLEPFALAADEGDDGDWRLDAVRRERNPRRAVLAAYALMERLLARDGLARGSHEAPMEYLGRVTLHGHPGAGSVHRLTALFQRARFSHRPVDEDMRRRAIAAVEELDGETGGEPA